MGAPTSSTSAALKSNSAEPVSDPIPLRAPRPSNLRSETPSEVAAAILVQTAIDHHPHLQAEIREQLPEPKSIAEMLVPYYKAMLEKMTA
jgi:hypothetical protein